MSKQNSVVLVHSKNRLHGYFFWINKSLTVSGRAG